ncbi:MAG: hypothetical protein IJ661_09395 [Lachnospiraceae bacterium]|nr:hypothetical protein [Lachnospiraceae bacterium]
MKPVNIYALTRIHEPIYLERLERQMSGRNRYMKIKKWEIEGLREFSVHLNEHMKDAAELDFYYSFTMPKLGKEFDLLRVNDEFVVNVELKSGNVTDEVIRKQLQQNKYYLATLGRNMYSYTYISGADRLVRLSNSGRIVDTEWEELAKVLERQENCFDGHIEELFKEDRYLISPLTDPGRFLRQEYFLTLQQKDIRKAIFKSIRHKDGHIKREFSVQGFTGLPGTGKTILLYDIAMQLSKGQRVCVLHFGSHEKELEQLDERLKRVDFYYCDDVEDIITCDDISNGDNFECNERIHIDRESLIRNNLDRNCLSKSNLVIHNYDRNNYENFRKDNNSNDSLFKDKQIKKQSKRNILRLNNTYSAILVDEGHRINEHSLSVILDLANQWKVPVIFSYDKEDAIAPEERALSGADLIEEIQGYVRYKLTNRIRMNSELSSFIACVMCVQGRNYRHDYPSVSLVYANDDKEAEILLHNFERDGYIYIWDEGVETNNDCDYDSNINDQKVDNAKYGSKTNQRIDNIEFADTASKKPDIKNAITSIETSAATCKEFDKVVMMIDDIFYYDENGFLRHRVIKKETSDIISRSDNDMNTVIECDEEYQEIDRNSRVRNLYHGLSRAKKNIGIVVKGNQGVFEALLYILQR